MQADRRFYVYVLFRPNGVPCYVGKGCAHRWTSHERRQTYANPHLQRIIAAAGGSLPRAKVREGLTNAEAVEAEVALIQAIGREKDGGPLVNLTDGGQGAPGRVLSAAHRAKTSQSVKLAWSDPVTAGRKIAAQRAAYVICPELREAARAKQRQIYNGNTEIRAKIAAKSRGRVWNDAQRLNASRSQQLTQARKIVRLFAEIAAYIHAETLTA